MVVASFMRRHRSFEPFSSCSELDRPSFAAFDSCLAFDLACCRPSEAFLKAFVANPEIKPSY